MLHLVVGTMKASKSSTLIDYVNSYTVSKEKKYTIFYPACCDKKDGYVVSRDNNKKAKAIKIFEIEDMYNYIDGIDLIFIDEFQFITDSYDIDKFMSFLEYCDKRDVTIYCFGLSLDYMSKPFNVTERVLPYADTVMILKANCDCCGKKNSASRCIRYVNGVLDDSPESSLLLMEGENIEYKSVCKDCYRKLTNLNAIK